MDPQQVKELIASLPQGRTLFYYFKDRYALILLEHAARDGCSVRQLKATRLAALLNKPLIRQFLGRLGSPLIRSSDCASYWPPQSLAYRLTLGHWPMGSEKWRRDWHQTTRKGHNLVLQLNLARSHVRSLHALVDIDETYYQCSGHPIAGRHELTLAWARLDVELETGEALIEEIQSDWVRDSISSAKYEDEWGKYVQRVLRPHVPLWDEAMLAAAIWFLRHELGIARIFYHTFETGVALKRIGHCHPPRSLYTTLPRRFCFQLTHNGPLFLRDAPQRSLRKQFREPQTQWYVLDFSL